MRVIVRPENDRVVLGVRFPTGGADFDLVVDVALNVLLAGEWESVAKAVGAAYRRGVEDCVVAAAMGGG